MFSRYATGLQVRLVPPARRAEVGLRRHVAPARSPGYARAVGATGRPGPHTGAGRGTPKRSPQ